MERHAVIEHTPPPAMIPEIRDEALFVQFTEGLYDSGFLFDDANDKEIESGEQIIQAFCAQANATVMRYLSETHLNHFIRYLQEHRWTKIEIQQKIHLKILNMFEQLSYGSHHSFNVRRNIRLELLHLHHQIFHEFLLYITAYYTLFLKKRTASTTITPSQTTKPTLARINQIVDSIPDEEVLEGLDNQQNYTKEDEADVLYGAGKITQDSCLKFIQEYSDSALKFVFRLDLTGKALPLEVHEIYQGWEARGMRRGHVRGFILEIMEWDAFPNDETIMDISRMLRNQIFNLKH